MSRGWIRRIEWPTIALVAVAYLAWFWLAFRGEILPSAVWLVAAAALTALYWSLVHEVVHGHPTSNRWFNFALVAVPLGWFYPLGRFHDGHLEHHASGALTDPFDDSESWYLAQRDWNKLSPPTRMLLTVNNTLAGRLTIGVAITVWRMLITDLKLLGGPWERGRAVAVAWLAHLPGVFALALLLSSFSAIPWWQFAIAAYAGAAIILIRTFLEHQASEHKGERTVIIEDKGPLAFLFLFNNLHCVHHARPGLAWYRLPGFYHRHRAQFIRRNNGYVYSSYWQVFRRHFLVPKEPVAHPFVA